MRQTNRRADSAEVVVDFQRPAHRGSAERHNPARLTVAAARHTTIRMAIRRAAVRQLCGCALKIDREVRNEMPFSRGVFHVRGPVRGAGHQQCPTFLRAADKRIAHCFARNRAAQASPFPWSQARSGQDRACVEASRVGAALRGVRTPATTTEWGTHWTAWLPSQRHTAHTDDEHFVRSTVFRQKSIVSSGNLGPAATNELPPTTSRTTPGLAHLTSL